MHPQKSDVWILFVATTDMSCVRIKTSRTRLAKIYINVTFEFCADFVFVCLKKNQINVDKLYS